MKLQGTLALAGLLGLGLAAAPASAPAQPYLPDSVVLARVEDRPITVFRFIDAFFASDPEFRPQPDSTGRANFLESLITQEVLSRVAREANRPFGFEDRAKMREHTDRVLSNVLYQRAVLDSVTVTEQDVRRAYDQCRYELRLAEVVVAEQEEARLVRDSLRTRKLSIEDAARRHSITREAADGGHLGWVGRLRYTPVVLAPRIFDMKPGTLSEPMRSREGYHIVQVLERREVTPGALEVLRRGLRNQLRAIGAEGRASRLQRQMSAEIGLAVDTAEARWAASRFIAANQLTREDNTFTLEVNAVMPHFDAADTGRVLARWNEGQLSLGAFLRRYSELSPLMRPNINDYALFREHVVSTALDPYMPILARRRGIDRDPLAIAEIRKREDQIRVEHLYEDSVASKIWIAADARKAYYEKNRNLYVTYPQVRFATKVKPTQAGIDSVAARLRAGEFLPDLIAADSLAGVTSGSVQSRSGAEHGAPYHKVLFEELRPGQFTVLGPDRQGEWLVIQLLEYVPERQLSYREAEHYVDESLTNMEAERLLKDLIARHRARMKIESRPELLARVHLVDPAGRE